MALKIDQLRNIALLMRFKHEYNMAETNFRLNEIHANPELAEQFPISDIHFAKSMVEQHAELGIHIYSILDPRYPRLLRQIPDPPSIIFVRGDKDIFKDIRSVSVVGSRDATPNGLIIARRISHYFASLGWCITSGLAKGIDAAAHDGALRAEGKTIAVLAHGLEKPQPKANESLGYKILESGGAWLSEHPVGTIPKPALFVRRNRLQIGISAGSIIVEAGLKSGSSTQARFCREQNRPLFAVVPETAENKLQLLSIGTQEFVRSQNAEPIRTKNDYNKVFSLLEQSQERLANMEI